MSITQTSFSRVVIWTAEGKKHMSTDEASNKAKYRRGRGGLTRAMRDKNPPAPRTNGDGQRRTVGASSLAVYHELRRQRAIGTAKAVTRRGIGAELGMTGSVVHYHIARLVEAGLLHPSITPNRELPGDVLTVEGFPAVSAQAVARLVMEESGWHRLAQATTEGDHDEAMDAIRIVAPYAYGRPTQPVSNPDGSPLDLGAKVLILSEYSTEQLRALVVSLEARGRIAAPGGPIVDGEAIEMEDTRGPVSPHGS